MKLIKLFLINILPLLLIHLLMITYSKITDTTELVRLELILILFTPAILFWLNYTIEAERNNAYFWQNSIMIFIANGLGLYLYFYGLGITFKNGMPYSEDAISAGISTLLYLVTIIQFIIGSLILYIKYHKVKL
ncbi:hypothetical protein [Rummeliibacillus suwonensis]|uniref:hypothetical protein n=1 Tax=Rummeliibacillus suwonensis TaxID=1306154 RepID=UPI0011B63A4E|nr:hypothetical protein [Rummeliibacillus suwonensis]